MSWISQVYGGKEDTKSLAMQTWGRMEMSLVEKKNCQKSKIEQEIMTAKKNGTKNKIVAIQALKSKKRSEKQVQQIDWYLSTIERQKEIIKSANSSITAIVAAMGKVADAVKATNQHKDAHSEVNDIKNLNEHDQLEKELEELVKEKLDKELSGTRITDESAPAVPATALPTLDLEQIAMLDKKLSERYQQGDQQKSRPISKL